MEKPPDRDDRNNKYLLTYTSVLMGSNDPADIFDADPFSPLSNPERSQSVPPHSEPVVPIFTRSIEEDLKPRELVSDFSQAIYYDSDVFVISKTAIRKYMHEFLFKKFPARENGVNSVREHVVTHVCSEYDELIPEAGLKHKTDKKTPDEFKDEQVVQLVRAIVRVKQKTVSEVRDPDPERRDNTALAALKIEMLNALLKAV